MIPDAYYNSIFDIDYGKLRELGIKNLFFDIDNTIVAYYTLEIDKKTINFFKELKKEFNIFLFSNSTKKRVLKISDILGIDAYYLSMKPLKRNYKKIINIFDKNECVFIGDQLLTDVLGAKRNGLKVIFVNRINEKEPLTTRVWRLIEKVYFRKYTKKNIIKVNEFYDRLRNA